jgi:hypothetical protein
MKYVLGISLICALNSSDIQSMILRCKIKQPRTISPFLQQRKYNAGLPEYEDPPSMKEEIKQLRETNAQYKKIIAAQSRDLAQLKKYNLALLARYQHDISDDPSRFYIEEYNMNYGNQFD